MTPDQIAEITRRARQDAAAYLNGYPNANRCPFSSVAEATLWRKQFDLALKEGKR